ncbi:MAG TPA: hypothetical protein VGE45_21720 [Chloroflexia bacterium]|jgi:hypothetical protein
MEEQERSSKISPEIYVYATNKHFVNLYDALRIDKVKIEIAGYDQATNRQTGHASAWLDKDDARLLSHLACNRLFMAVTGGKWEKYGGSQREDGSIESRTLTVEWDEGDGGRFARFPYRLTIANGPGKKTATGGVSPAGEPTSRLSMRMPELDAIKMLLALGDYIRAYETAHHHRLVAQRVRDLRDKLAERSGRVDLPTTQPEPAQQDRRAVAASSPANAPAARPNLKAMPGGNRAPNRIDRLDSARVG